MPFTEPRNKRAAEATVQLATRVSLEARERLDEIISVEKITIRDLLEAAITERWRRVHDGQEMLEPFIASKEKNIA